MEYKKKFKGCVYFFKQSNVQYVNIGVANGEEDFKSKFRLFKHFAPLGAEIIGFIPTNKASLLVKDIYDRLGVNKVSVGWFDISIKEAVSIINTSVDNEFKEYKNNLELMLANGVIEEKNEELTKGFSEIVSKHRKKGFEHLNVLNQSELIEKLNITKKELKRNMSILNIEYRNNKKEDGGQKKGYKFFSNNYL